jgi:hypothetical protein
MQIGPVLVRLVDVESVVACGELYCAESGRRMTCVQCDGLKDYVANLKVSRITQRFHPSTFGSEGNNLCRLSPSGFELQDHCCPNCGCRTN